MNAAQPGITRKLTLESNEMMKKSRAPQPFSTVPVGFQFHFDNKVFEKLDHFSASQILFREDGSLDPLTAIRFQHGTLVQLVQTGNEST